MVNKRFQFKRLRTKILAGFGLLIFIVFLMSTYNYMTISKMNSQTSDIVDEQLPLLISEKDLLAEIYESSSFPSPSY